ncbi:MAG: hypothetical protein K6F55_08230 [Eubacterium sp.]|nr:hypothetical protein [Eubacterium sp.]
MNKKTGLYHNTVTLLLSVLCFVFVLSPIRAEAADDTDSIKVDSYSELVENIKNRESI